MAKGSSGGKNPTNAVLGWSIGLASLALLLFIMLIIFGNLQGNTGFAANSQGANDTTQFIGNYTASVKNTGAQFPIVGTILGISLLLVILIALLVFAIRGMKNAAGGTTSGSGSFG